MFGLCHAWPGVVFDLISVGLHFAQFSLSQEELVLSKDTEVHLSRGFQLFQSADGRGRTAHITDEAVVCKVAGSRIRKAERRRKKYLLLIDSL